MDLQSVGTYCTRLCFSLTVYDVFTLNPLDVECLLIDNLVLDALFFLLVVSGFELAACNCEYSAQICT